MVLKLLDEVYHFHATSPCYMPLSQDTAASIRANNEKAWSDPGTIHWAARYQGNVVGALALTLPKTMRVTWPWADPSIAPIFISSTRLKRCAGWV
jgi:hypothetical protein